MIDNKDDESFNTRDVYRFQRINSKRKKVLMKLKGTTITVFIITQMKLKLLH